MATYTRKPGTGGEQEDPELVKLPAEQRAMAKQALARLASEKDVDKLKQRLARLEESAAQVPAEAKPMMDWMKKKVQERIAELEKK